MKGGRLSSVRRGGPDLGVHEPEPGEFLESEIAKMKRIEIEAHRMKNFMSKSMRPLPEDRRTAGIQALLKVCRIFAFATAPALYFALKSWIASRMRVLQL